MLLANYLNTSALEAKNIQIVSTIVSTGVIILKYPDFNGRRIESNNAHGIDLTSSPTSVFQQFQASRYSSHDVLEITESLKYGFDPSIYLDDRDLENGVQGKRSYDIIPLRDASLGMKMVDWDTYTVERMPNEGYGGIGDVIQRSVHILWHYAWKHELA